MLLRSILRPGWWALALAAAALCTPLIGCDRAAQQRDADPSVAQPTAPDLTGPEVSSLLSDPAGGDAGPALGTGMLFFPLEQGNRWTYERHVVVQLVPDQGEPPPPELLEATIETQIDGTEERFGRTYIVAHQVWLEDGDRTDRWIRYRQDCAGLYEADVLSTEPPTSAPEGGRLPPAVRVTSARSQPTTPAVAPLEAAIADTRARWAQAPLDAGWLRALDQLIARRSHLLAAVHAPRPPSPRAADVLGQRGEGGVLENELLRLDYPLRPRARWSVHPTEPELFVLTVEGPQLLRLPAGMFAGWRLRMNSLVFAPEDQVHFWFGRCGELQLVARLVSEATDDLGNRIGTLVWEERNALADIELSRRACR